MSKEEDSRREDNTDIERLAELIVEGIKDKASNCLLTHDEQHSLKDILKTKKKAVTGFFYVMAAVFLWAAKDVYNFITSNIRFIWGGD